MNPDQINAGFEIAAGLIVWLNVRQVLRDRTVHGVHWLPILLFAVWGLWNCWYYRTLGQPWSAYVASLVAGANTAWLLLVLRYWPRAAEAKVLELLADGKWWYGLDLVEASDGVLARGTIYITLARLMQSGQIISAVAPKTPGTAIRRKLYCLKPPVGRNPPPLYGRPPPPPAPPPVALPSVFRLRRRGQANVNCGADRP